MRSPKRSCLDDPVERLARGTTRASHAPMAIISSRLVRPLTLAPLALTLNGCAVIGGIFKAGMLVGVVAVLVIVALIIWAIRAFMR